MEITFRLAGPLPLPNRTNKLHWAARSRAIKALAWEALAAIGRKPAEPLPRASITVWRHGIQQPDNDNLTASLKWLLDVLQPASKRHPYGLGIIAGDDPDRLEARILHVKARYRTDQCTVVCIKPLEATP